MPPPPTARRVVIVGMGGLGSPAALALARTGLVELTLVDHDEIALSNIHRQVLYETGDVGASKVEIAARRLRDGFPGLAVRPVAARFEASTAASILDGQDFVIDGSDRTETKFAVHDAAIQAGIAMSYAGVVGWVGQSLTILPGESACLRCLFPETPLEDETPTCQQGGVLGGLAACFGAIQAAEAVKYVTGHRNGLLTNRVVSYDAWARRWHEVRLRRRPDCSLCGR